MPAARLMITVVQELRRNHSRPHAQGIMVVDLGDVHVRYTCGSACLPAAGVEMEGRICTPAGPVVQS